MKAILLTHGAGSNAHTPLLRALRAEFEGMGWRVVAYDLPFRQARGKGPPRPAEAAGDRAGIREEVNKLRAAGYERVYVGGHSYGGRQASMLAAEEEGLIDGLLLLSYPLHPPRQRDRMRTQHFPTLRTPVMFLSGTKDEFGTVEELTEAARLVSGRVEIEWLEGAGHGLKDKAAGVIAAWFGAFAGSLG